MADESSTTTCPEPMSSGWSESQSTTTSLKEKASDAADQAQGKAAEIGRSAEAKINAAREPAASALNSAAATLHEKAGSLPGGERVTSIAHAAADKIESTADYVRGHDVRDAMADVEDFVKSHPGQSLIAAAAVGFLVGRALRR
jgi:ElaB/YqjD/DUF883 family membrane-anchored ribosome-binding protein